MKTEIIKKNKGDGEKQGDPLLSFVQGVPLLQATQKFLGFFGTAPSQKTPRTRTASNFKLYTLNFKLPVFIILSSLFFTLSFVHVHALITSGVASKAGNLSRGLIGYWTFDGKNMTSSTSTDTSGSGNDGAFHGSPTVSLGAVGQAVTLSGSSYISAVGNNNTTFAVSAWFKVSQSNNYQPILEYSDSLNARYGVFIDGAHPGFVGVDYSNAGTRQLQNQTSGTRKDDGQWHHVVAMNSGGANPVMYIDGAQVTLGNAATPSAASSPNILEIGTFTFTPGSTYFFNGTLDDIRLYNRTLSTAEVLALYKMGNNTTAAVNNKNSGTSNGGLLGWWTFDGKNLTNATATDSSGGGNDGSFVNMTATSSSVLGKIGQALSFDGVSKAVNIADNANLRPGTGPFTYSAWIKPPNQNQFGAFLSKRLTSATFNQVTIAAGSTDGSCNQITTKKISIYIVQNGVGDAYCSNTTNDVVDGNWHHIVLVRLANGTVQLYVDGVSAALSVGVNNVHGAGGDISNTAPVRIGDGNSGTLPYLGLVDDVRIYNRALSTSEITAIYKTGQTSSSYGVSSKATNPLSNGLVGYWTFDGKNMNSSTSTDSSGNGNDGGFVNTSGSAVVAGKVGQAMNFTAYNQYINVPANSTLDLTNKLSISMWVKPVANAGVYRHLLTRNNSNVAIYNIALDNNTQRVILQLYGTGNCTLFSSGSLQTGVWSHITGTYDGSLPSANMKIYINGVQDASTCNYTGNVGASISSVPLTINNDLVNLNGVIGSMDDVRLYNRTLSAKEAMALYKMGAK